MFPDHQMRVTSQIVPFGTARHTIVMPALTLNAGLTESDSERVRILRGNTAEEAVSSIPAPVDAD
jgi:hypothetical protein